MVDRLTQPAHDDSIKAQPRRRFSQRQVGAALLVVVLLVVLLLLCVVWIPRWLYPSLTDADLRDVHAENMSDAAKRQELTDARLKLQNDARTTLLQGLGAVLVLTGATGGVWVTLRQIGASHDQLKLSEQGQVTDRYTKAVDHLGNKELAVRLGGIYALQRIAHDSPNDRPTIAEVLCTYARTATRESSPDRDLESHTFDKRSPDVHAVLIILGEWRRRVGEDAKWRDLHGADYRGANLEKAELPYSYFYDAQLQGALLKEANLEHADLSRAQLQGADLRDARLEGANLFDANLQGVKADEHTVWPEWWRDSALRREAGIEEISHEYQYRPDVFDDASTTTPGPSPGPRLLPIPGPRSSSQLRRRGRAARLGYRRAHD